MAKTVTIDGHEIVLDYASPRISSEIYECGLPLTFDQYNRCGFNCRYCFAAFLASACAESVARTQGVDVKSASKYRNPVRAVDPDRFKRLWMGASSDQGWSKTSRLIVNLLRKRTPLHWGGLSDPFCPLEKRFKIGLELITFLRGIDWPVVFSSKGTLMIEEPWASVMAGGDFRFQFSLTTLDPVKGRYSEGGTEPTRNRLDAMRVVTGDMKCRAILRLRPIVPGYITPDEAVHLMELAAKAGAEAVSTEFFCLESRGQVNREKYKYMSEPIGFDLYDFYREHSPGQAGYLRLNRALKAQWFLPMASAARKLGMRFAVSDKDFKELGTSDGCCGAYSNDEAANGYDGRAAVHLNRGTNTYAIIYAREHGKVTWSDIEPHLDWAGELMDASIQGLMCSAATRQKNREKTLRDALHGMFNDPNNSKSPYRYSGGKVVPAGLDANGDMVYEYTEEAYDQETREVYAGCSGCACAGAVDERPDVSVGSLVRHREADEEGGQ